MRILFDAYWWVGGPISNRTVLRDFIVAWAARFPDDEIHIAVPRRHVTAVLLDPPVPPSRIHGARAPNHGLFAMFELGLLARIIRVDHVVSQNFSTVLGMSSDTLIQDFLFVTHPEWFSILERAYFALMPLTARRARSLLTSSRSEAERIRAITGKSVAAVGLGVSSELVASIASAPEGIEPGFVLLVGRLNVRKNLEFALRSLVDSGVLSVHRPAVVVGERDGVYERFSELQELQDSGLVRFAGFAPLGELKWLYENCHLFVFLSLGEGYGLPPLEAASMGAPRLVVSDIPVMRELFDGRATLASPSDRTATAVALRTAYSYDRPPSKLSPWQLSQDWQSMAERARRALTCEK